MFPMPKLTFLQLAQKVLEEEKKSLSPEEIWQVALNKGYDSQVSSKGRTPSRTVGAQLYVEVRDNPTSIFAKTDTRPKRFYLRKHGTPETNQQAESEPTVQPAHNLTYLEKDLHPFMAYFGFNYLKASLKTIHHAKSDKKEFGEWVHPDMIGCYFSFQNWNMDVVEVSSVMGNTGALKLFSFELKRQLNFSNLRESFFQAVSNSSWANEGYLVAAEVSEDEDFRNELKRLSSSFGIGVIELDLQDPDSTNVIFPALTRNIVDWDTVSKMTLNPDFRDFLKRIKNDYQSREVRQEQYDKVFSKETLLQSLRGK